MLRVRGITHHRTPIQGLPSRPREMDRHNIPLILVAGNKVRMRHRLPRWGKLDRYIFERRYRMLAGVTHSPAVRTGCGNRQVLSNLLTGVVIYTVDQAGFLL